MLVPVMLAGTAFVTQIFWYAEGREILSLPLLDWTLVVREGALARGLELASRIIGGMSLLLFFALTTPLPELMRAARFFRCPSVLVELALIMYRYLFLLMEEGIRIQNAERARLGFVSLRSTLRSSGILGGMLLLRTYDRAERSFEAMRCRGYRGALTSVTPTAMQSHDWLVLVLGSLLLAGLYWAR
jgi:cobalt/nickel transport system permease protein